MTMRVAGNPGDTAERFFTRGTNAEERVEARLAHISSG